jgi:hypothetical protein
MPFLAFHPEISFTDAVYYAMGQRGRTTLKRLPHFYYKKTQAVMDVDVNRTIWAAEFIAEPDKIAREQTIAYGKEDNEAGEN